MTKTNNDQAFRFIPNPVSRMSLSLLMKMVGGVATAGVFVGIFLWVGRWDWFRGWAYIGLLVVGFTLNGLYLGRKNPELLRRRGQIGKGTKSWDLVILGLFGLSYLAIPVVAAFDARHQGARMALWLWPVGAVMFAGFIAVFTWAMAVNPFFEKTVRIQRDRNHQVITSGPYRIVRHPGYIATLLGFVLATPLLLGSWWAFIPAALAMLCLILRTALEDRTLRKELAGYEAYSRKVRYRLLPGLW